MLSYVNADPAPLIATVDACGIFIDADSRLHNPPDIVAIISACSAAVTVIPLANADFVVDVGDTPPAWVVVKFIVGFVPISLPVNVPDNVVPPDEYVVTPKLKAQLAPDAVNVSVHVIVPEFE